MTDPHPGSVVCWLLDTRTLWPGDKIGSAAAEDLKLISKAEQDNCLRKYFAADARMSLGSALLKRLFISKALNIPWKDIKVGRKDNPQHGKPVAILPDGTFAPIDFNVSHQAGLVTLIGWVPPDLKSRSSNSIYVGTDIVCVGERDDNRTIDTEGFDGWVDIYDIVFSDEERWDMKYNVDRVTLLDGQILKPTAIGRSDRCIRRNQDLTATLPSGQKTTFSSDLLIDAKLRRFYTFFCYKEAYIKLEGEALLAPWLKELEFQNVRSPEPGTVARCSTHGVWGEKVEDVEILLHKRPVQDVKMAIQSFEENFMISTAVKGPLLPQIPSFVRLHLENDVLAHARAS